MGTLLGVHPIVPWKYVCVILSTSRKLTAGGPQHDGLEKVTGPFKNGNFGYLCWISWGVNRFISCKLFDLAKLFFFAPPGYFVIRLSEKSLLAVSLFWSSAVLCLHPPFDFPPVLSLVVLLSGTQPATNWLNITGYKNHGNRWIAE